MKSITQNKLLEIHQSLQDLMEDHGIFIYIWWWLGIAFLAGKIYRENKDLDYIVSYEELNQIHGILSQYSDYKYIWITDKWSYKYIHNWVEIEFETLESINQFVFSKTWKNPDLSNEDLYIGNIYTLNYLKWFCVKRSFYYKIRDIFGEPKYKIDKEVIDSLENI